MNYIEEYNKWRESDYIDKETKIELEGIKENREEIEERFYTNLSFGTGGIRGIIGAGTNRMNIYTVGRATQGLAEYINQQGEDAKKRGVVIAYDSRYKSEEFAAQAAQIFAANGIKAYLFDELTPTPELSFAVRELKAISGIVVTASHNPPEYNGYKVYWEDGGQLPPLCAEAVQKIMNNIDIFKGIKVMDKQKAIEQGLIQMIGEEIHNKFLQKVKEQSINPEVIEKVADKFKIIYTPFHGTGNKPVRRILDMIGLKNVMVVKEQELPDPTFPTVKSPNPEEKEGFAIAIEMAKKHNVDLIIGTDPDCDRVGIIVKDKNGEHINLTGNQTGILLTEYILSQQKEKGILPDNPVVIKTVVTTEMVKEIADTYNVEVVEVLTGFKFIGEKIKEFEEDNDKQYVFGFEESYGYLAGTHARDKDAVVASMLIVEMAAWYKSRNMTLYEGLMELYDKYGVFIDGIEAITLKGKEGIKKMKAAMERLRNDNIKSINGVNVTFVTDYKTGKSHDVINNRYGKINFPESNVLRFELEDKSWFAVRPSGTEPKIKIYFEVKGEELKDTYKKMETFKKMVLEKIKI